MDNILKEYRYKKALEYFEVTANQDHDLYSKAIAQFNLGLVCLHGRGIDVNYDKAKQYFELSLQQNNSAKAKHLSELFLSIMYCFGKGVEINYQQTKDYLKQAKIYFEDKANNQTKKEIAAKVDDYESILTCMDDILKEKRYGDIPFVIDQLLAMIENNEIKRGNKNQ